MGKCRFVDLSLELKEGLGVEADEVPPALKKLIEILAPKVKYTDHKTSVPDILASFPGTSQEDLPGGLGWSEETLTVNTHAGTHFDAPYHYAPTAEGKPAKTVDEIPLEWCFNNGVVLDMRHKQAGEVIGVDDLKAALSKINYSIKPLDIVMIMTGVDKKWNTLEYWTSYPGTGREGTIWLAEQGVKIVGTDAAGWDRPFQYAAAAFRETGNRALIWEGHYAGIDCEYCQMEKLTNLDKLPSHGFQVSCFPIKILKASAGWVRPVAIIDEG
jgi:kynurenine formamidase